MSARNSDRPKGRQLGRPVGLVAWVALVAALPSPVHAQTPAPAAGTLAGVVVDVVTGDPIPGVVVTLARADGGLVVAGRASGEVGPARVAVTTAEGAYRFTDLTPGVYRVRLERLGYRGRTVEVELRRAVDAAVSVGLELDPVTLAPARAAVRATSLFQRSAGGPSELDETRIAAERTRQALFLAPDARVVTYADVVDGVTLGEGDVFRALQRLPGVGTRDDYTAEIWTRGAPWTHTRVTFDGIPLYNPVHAVGVLSAISPEILGTVFFHPGVRPVSLPEGAAGAVDLRSRPGSGDGGVRGAADVSLATAKLALEQEVHGRGAWMIVGRRSHLGLFPGGLGGLGLDTLELPYRFHDVAARLDLSPTDGVALEASGLWEEDRLHGDVEGVIEGTGAHWGNVAGRVTGRVSVGGAELVQTVGGSRFLTRTDEHRVRVREAARAWTEPASWNEIQGLQLSGALAPGRGEPDGARWKIGYDVVLHEAHYEGPLPRFHAVRPDTTATVRRESTLTVAGVWVELRTPVAERLTVSLGARLEGGGTVSNGGEVRASPRVAARWSLTPDLSFSAAAGRSWQYTQAIGLAGPSIHPAFHASHFWVLADDDSPAVRSDVLSAGVEWWLGGGWLGSATVFLRNAEGVTVPDPTPGRLLRRPLFVEAENRAHGVDAAVRRIGARWSTSLGWAWSLSELEADGRRYPSPADRRHLVDAMAGVRLSPSLRVAAAFTGMSGAPFTRAYTRSPLDCATFGFGCDNPEGSWVEEPNAERTPPYRGLDASVHWTRPVLGAEVTSYVQVRNVLGRTNATTYAGTVPLGRVQTPDGWEILWDDRFEPGLPRLPLVGLRVVF